MKNSIDLNDLFTRGVGDFIDPEGKLKEKIAKSPEKIVIKFGVDPTRPDLHLGHAVVLRKLRKFQDLGCKIIFLVGDLTAQIGDPTGKSKIRPEIAQKEIEVNMKTYLDQVGKILRTEKEVFTWIRNSDWFVSIHDIVPSNNSTDLTQKVKHWLGSRMQSKNNIKTYSFLSILAVLRQITFNRLIERDMFQERIKNNEPVFMHEMMYPVLQGIDSNVIADIYGSCDLEVGGSDQFFNMLVGRDVMTMAKKEPQSVMSFQILEGTDGKEKMSKSLDNYIAITDEPINMFGKVMSIPDKSIPNYFELATFEPMSEIEKIKKELTSGKVNPRDLKVKLGKEIVAIYHGEKAAKDAEENFINVFQKKEIPEDMPEISVFKDDSLAEVLVKNKIVKSKSEFSRLVEENAVHNLDSKEEISDIHYKINKDLTLKIGKKRFLKIKVK